MFTQYPGTPLAPLRAAARLNKNINFVTTKNQRRVNVDVDQRLLIANHPPYKYTAMAPQALHKQNWILIQNGRFYCRHTSSKPTGEMEGPREAKKRRYNCGNVGSYSINPS